MANLLAVLSAPSSTDLVTRAQVKEALGILPGEEKDDAFIDRCIRGASAYFVRRLGRPLAVQTVTEGFTSIDRLRLVLGIRPLVSVSAIRMDGVALASDDWAIENRAVAILFRSSGWGGSGGRVARGISLDTAIETGERVIEIDYRGGYFLPSMTLPMGTGETALPGDLVDAAIEMTAFNFYKRDRDPGESSSRVGDSSATYITSSVPIGVQEVADAYADVM